MPRVLTGKTPNGHGSCPGTTIVVCTMRKSWVAGAVVLLGQLGVGLALEPAKRLDQYVRTTWTGDRGLPQSSVFCVTETRDGYLWIATQEGFVRFDGHEFVTYDKNTDPQIVSNMAVTIRGTRDGSLYVGTVDGGLVRRRGDRVDIITQADGLPSNTITALDESCDGSLWIGTDSGLARLSGGRITIVPLVQPLVSD